MGRLLRGSAARATRSSTTASGSSRTGRAARPSAPPRLRHADAPEAELPVEQLAFRRRVERGDRAACLPAELERGRRECRSRSRAVAPPRRRPCRRSRRRRACPWSRSRSRGPTGRRPSTRRCARRDAAEHWRAAARTVAMPAPSHGSSVVSHSCGARPTRTPLESTTSGAAPISTAIHCACQPSRKPAARSMLAELARLRRQKRPAGRLRRRLRGLEETRERGLQPRSGDPREREGGAGA